MNEIKVPTNYVLDALAQQRDTALNSLAQHQAMVRALKDQIAELEKVIQQKG